MVSRDGITDLLGALVPALSVLLVFGLLVAAAGVWPPFFAVESGSMEPHLERGDLVFVTTLERYAPDGATEAGVVTRDAAGDYHRLGSAGDVIVFAPPSRAGAPVIHRAHFHVERGENWYADADAEYLPTSVDDCEELAHCPAPHAGYVTKGDANAYYDQTGGLAPVRVSWTRGKAQAAIPWVGHLRLFLAGA